jgi:hypothetical protein
MHSDPQLCCVPVAYDVNTGRFGVSAVKLSNGRALASLPAAVSWIDETQFARMFPIETSPNRLVSELVQVDVPVDSHVYLIMEPVSSARFDNGPYGDSSGSGTSLLADSLLRPMSALGRANVPIVQRVNTMVANLLCDFEELNVLEFQRKKWHLGHQLLRALPVTCCETNSSALDPCFVDMLLPYVGTVNEYWSAIREQNVLGEQHGKCIVAVAQASGSGKTRLSYALGQEKAFVVIVRIAMHRTEKLSAPWSQWVTSVSKAQMKFHTADGRTAAAFGMSSLRLLVASYVEWVALVLTEIREKRRNITVAQLREACLRALRNGSGDSAVLALFSFRMTQFFPDGAPINDSHEEDVKSHTQDVNRLLRNVIGDAETVVISFDEVQQLLFELRDCFYPLAEWSNSALSSDGLQRQSRSAYHALVALMPWLMDNLGWRQSMCGSYFQISEEAVSKLSPIAKRVAPLYHTSRIEVADMERVLCTFFHFRSADFCRGDVVRSCLDYFRGRPKFFFGHTWSCIWRRICMLDNADTDISDLVRDALMEARVTLSRERERDVNQLWTQPQLIASNPEVTTAFYCQELYASLKFTDGSIVTSGVDADVVRYGIFASLPESDEKLDLKAEPATVAAILSVGDRLVWRAADDPSTDPVFMILARCVKGGRISGFHFTTSVKGHAWELGCVWHVLRSRIISNGVELSLSHLISPMLSSNFHLPASLNMWRVLAEYGQDARQLDSTAPTQYHAFLSHPDRLKLVVYDLDTSAGADVLLLVQNKEDDSDVALVSIQCKAEKSSSLAECLRSCSPSWQFTTVPQRL